jgi:hypothetical protein
MVLFLVFTVTLLAAVLLSGLAERTVLSTAVLFLVVGFLAGGVANFLTIRPEDPLTTYLAELALFAVLFTDGMRLRRGHAPTAPSSRPTLRRPTPIRITRASFTIQLSFEGAHGLNAPAPSQ